MKASDFSPLPREFFLRDARTVARQLIGKLLVRRAGRRLLVGRIVEAEAYLGLRDPGSHAFRGPTERNRVLFGPPGYAYVYFIYGNHYCTNISCHPEGDPGCVLLRALEPIAGLAEMAANRGLPLSEPPTIAQRKALTSGPGRLSEALGITRPAHNGLDLCSKVSTLYFSGDVAGDEGRPPRVVATTRINVTAAPHDRWRFIAMGSDFISGPASSPKHPVNKQHAQ
jgi:DNA-3-methyladenine glycosylase